MKLIMENWRVFTEEEQKDSKKVAKVVIYNDKNEVLFIKRSNYNKKFVGEWDLPGGHAHEGEPMEEAARREAETAQASESSSSEEVSAGPYIPFEERYATTILRIRTRLADHKRW